MQKLRELRNAYLRTYPHRNFSVEAENNEEYQKLLDDLACDRLEEYRKRAGEQAKAAEEQMEQAYGQMGELAPVRDRIDEVIER